MADIDWRYMPWTIYDLETTGAEPETARVVQVALVRMEGGQVVKAAKTLCNPGLRIPEEASAVHGITDAMVADAPSDSDVIANLAAGLADASVIVSYNGFRFDDAIVARIAGIDLDVLWSNAVRVDTLLLVRHDKIGRFWKGTGRHKLAAVAEKLGIHADGAMHDAGTDAAVTGRILWHLVTSEPYASVVSDILPSDHTVTATLRRFAAAQEVERQKYLMKLAKMGADKET